MWRKIMNKKTISLVLEYLIGQIETEFQNIDVDDVLMDYYADKRYAALSNVSVASLENKYLLGQNLEFLYELKDKYSQ